MKGLDTLALAGIGSATCIPWALDRPAWTKGIPDNATVPFRYDPLSHGFLTDSACIQNGLYLLGNVCPARTKPVVCLPDSNGACTSILIPQL
jgi:hypothetical protein